MKTIVSIDDETDILRCFQDALQYRGYRVLTASDPDTGIALVRTTPEVQLLLLDIKMPKKDGFAVYREIRAFRRLPVLFITAYPKSFNADSDEIVTLWREEFADGTTDILYKPFGLETLYSKVESLIGTAADDGP
jgi:DNA-binding response OmpR family regulator